jgi:hypothetical protein
MHGPWLLVNMILGKNSVLLWLLKTTAYSKPGNLPSGLCDAYGLLGRRDKNSFTDKRLLSLKTFLL